MPPGLDADTKNKAAVHRRLVQHGARRTVRARSHLAHIIELAPIMLTRWLHVLKHLACLSVPCFLTKDFIKSFGNF